MPVKKLFNILRKGALKIAHPAVLFYTMPWLIFLLTVGTLAQKEMGLYLAHKIYFASWFFWVGPVPLPGTYLTLGLITLSLGLKFLFKSPLKLRMAGTWITHLGILVLLIGGLLTALSQKEGFIVLAEAGQTNIVSDYHQRVLRFYKNDTGIFEKDLPDIKTGDFTPGAPIPFQINIRDICANCMPAHITEPGEIPRHGMAAKVDLGSIPPEKENELNFSGMTLLLSRLNEATDGQYILMEEMSPELSFQNGDDIYTIRLGRAQRALPFHIKLTDFQKEMHPATNMARAYHSDVTVMDGAVSWPVRIEMNKPLRYKGYTLYQSSFSIHPDGTEHSVLSVVENKGRLFPYIASILIGLGLIVHLILRMKSTRIGTATYLAILSAGLLWTPGASYAYGHEDPVFQIDAFAQLPILHMGRVKPVDSFARTNLKILRGTESYKGLHATHWLARTIFDPAAAIHDPVFRVFKPEIAGLASKDTPYYSYSEIAPALLAHKDTIRTLLETDEDAISADQSLLLDLHESSIIYTQLLRSFSAQLPLNVALPDSLARDWNIDPSASHTLHAYKDRLPDIEKKVQDILKKKGYDPQTYSNDERALVEFAYALSVVDEAGQQNRILRVFPGEWKDAANAKTEWFSPWAVTQAAPESPLIQEYMALWSEMMRSYRAQDPALWAQAAQNTLTFMENQNLQQSGYAAHKIKLERLYNTLHPLKAALIFFTLTLLVCLAARALSSRKLYMLALATFGIATLLNLSVIVLRVLILDRPPVGTLYESLLFVSLICACIAVIMEYKRKDLLGLALGAVSGAVLLFISASFEGPDSLQVLVAVLNTNFWLTTHVLIITAGYGWCIIAACAAHAYLFLRWRGQSTPAALQNLLAHIKTLALISLLFTAVGTILGGIWADQSWGRFWGWDPKENGALLIVLWLVWILHGQLSGHLNSLAGAALFSCLNIIVALAWFGVNLLNTGLHSYGFIEGVAGGLALFCALELLLIGGFTLKIYLQEKKYVAA